MRRVAPNGSRVIFSCTELAIFDTSRSTARKELLCQEAASTVKMYMLHKSMWQVSSGLKEDEMGSQGPQCHGAVKKFHFR